MEWRVRPIFWLGSRGSRGFDPGVGRAMSEGPSYCRFNLLDQGVPEGLRQKEKGARKLPFLSFSPRRTGRLVLLDASYESPCGASTAKSPFVDHKSWKARLPVKIAA